MPRLATVASWTVGVLILTAFLLNLMSAKLDSALLQRKGWFKAHVLYLASK